MSATGEHESFSVSASPAAAGKPRFALFVATACGLGYLPKAPGTWGSLGGLVLVTLPFWAAITMTWILGSFGVWGASRTFDPILMTHLVVTAAIAAVGVWSADRAAAFWKQHDPQRVVIDEVSGQHLAIVLGVAVPVWWRPTQLTLDNGSFGFITMHSVLSWKYLLLGFILFRLFDIWKPFPARQAESLPGGWGIMTDDWVAGIYAAIGLWIARAAGL